MGNKAAIGIDQIGDLDVLRLGDLGELADMLDAAGVDAGHGDADGVVGAQHAGRGLRADEGETGGGESARGSAFQEITAAATRHAELLDLREENGAMRVGTKAADRLECLHDRRGRGASQDSDAVSRRGQHQFLSKRFPSLHVVPMPKPRR